MSNPILVTKLFIPAARPELVPRPRLIEKLNDGLHRKLTLISAPAGFGKTTVVMEWLQAIGGVESSLAWLSLDDGDNDPTRFLTYFIAALNQVEETDTIFGEGSLSLLQSPQPPPIETVLTPLINEIAPISHRIIFVLDDYHLVDSQPIQDILSFFLENLPPQLHLVITTREDPLLPLPRLRARGQLTELRAADLRFTSAEAAEFLNQVMGLDLSTEDIAALETRTEGWIAGLQLAALALQGTISLQGDADKSKLIQSFTGSNRLVLDYLIEEVLDQQPEEIQNFLLQTSILDRLTGSLCDAVRFDRVKSSGSSFRTAPKEHESGQEILEKLDRANLFIIPLDNERQWYRYHHLFADLLRQRLNQAQPERIQCLHIRASQWYEEKGLTPDAIHHALIAEDFERVADLAELAWPTWSGPIQLLVWFGWLKHLPDKLIRCRPVLCVAYAQALLNTGELEAAEARMRDVEQWLEIINDDLENLSAEMVIVDQTQFQTLPASLATARAYHAQAIGNVHSTVKYVEQVLDLLPEDDIYKRASVTGLLGLAYWASGNIEAAYRTFSEGLFQNAHDRIKGTFVLADMKMTLGQLHEAERICEHGLHLAKEHDPPFPWGSEDVYTGISEIHREQGDLDIAAQDLAASKELGDQIELPDWEYRWCIAQARLKETLGDLDGALELLNDAERLFVRTPLPVIRPIAAMKTRAWVKQGKLTEALGWVREMGLSVDDDLSYLREFEHITLTRILIAQYKSDPVDDSVRLAIGFLERLLKTAEDGKRTGSAIEILVLRTLAYEVLDDTSSALIILERALNLAEPEGYFRIFVDEGPPMATLLYKAISRGIAPDYVQHLLAAFPNIEAEPPNLSQSQTSDTEWIETLSERELEVLQLIAEGLTNQKIGAQLYLSLNTIKAHTRSIYGKLDVNSRTQAVSRARTLGLISTD